MVVKQPLVTAGQMDVLIEKKDFKRSLSSLGRASHTFPPRYPQGSWEPHLIETRGLGWK